MFVIHGGLETTVATRDWSSTRCSKGRNINMSPAEVVVLDGGGRREMSRRFRLSPLVFSAVRMWTCLLPIRHPVAPRREGVP